VEHDQANKLLGAYALDACDETETNALNIHLSVCVECATDAERLREAAGWLGTSEATPPRGRLRLIVLDAIAESDPLAP
jgi:hypothetical protein